MVRGLELAAECELQGIYNLGTGVHTRVDRLVELLNEELGTTVEPVYEPNPIPPDVFVQHTCADPSAFRDATGWAPQIDLAGGIERVCAPYRTESERPIENRR